MSLTAAAAEERCGGWRSGDGARGASEPNVFVLLKHGSGGGVADGAEVRLAWGVRHVVAERWAKAEEWVCWAV